MPGPSALLEGLIRVGARWSRFRKKLDFGTLGFLKIGTQISMRAPTESMVKVAWRTMKFGQQLRHAVEGRLPEWTGD